MSFVSRMAIPNTNAQSHHAGSTATEFIQVRMNSGQLGEAKDMVLTINLLQISRKFQSSWTSSSAASAIRKRWAEAES